MNFLVQFFGTDPVTELSGNSLCRFRNRIDLFLGTNHGSRLNSGHVLGVGSGEEAVVVLGERDEDSLLDQIGFELKIE